MNMKRFLKIIRMLQIFIILSSCQKIDFGNSGDTGNWVTYQSSNSGLIDNYINCIAVDAQGNK